MQLANNEQFDFYMILLYNKSIKICKGVLLL